jgi:Tfp pilus assembly protein PilX
MRKKMIIRCRKNEQGAALAVGLILLLIITLMGYTGMKGTMLQEKMAAGLHNRSLAYGGANSALREGERFLFQLVENSNGVVVEGTPNGELFKIYSYYLVPGDPTSGINPVISSFIQRDFTSTAGTDHSHNFLAVTEKGAALKELPEYIIYNVKTPASPGGGSASGAVTQEFGSGSSNSGGGSLSDQQVSYFVTGKSTSGDGNTMAMVQSLYTVVGSSNPSQ